MGLTCSKAIATSIDINPQVLVEIPKLWSIEDGAASINSLFLIWYSLIDRAQLEEGKFLSGQVTTVHSKTLPELSIYIIR